MDEHDDAPLDPQASAALIAEQRARVEAAVDVDGRVLFTAWGVAWTLGFGLLWAADAEASFAPGTEVALLAFAGLLGAAGVVTAVHLVRRSRGVRGASARQGAMYGWAWFLGFGVVAALASALARAGVADDVMTLAMMAVSLVVVGTLYMAGGAVWDAPTQFALGAVILVATIVAVLVGPPHTYLVMCVGGGGAMLAGAVVEAVRRRAPREL